MVRHVGQLPLTYRHHPTGGRSNPTGAYVDGPAEPLWPFGFGLSHGQIELANLRLDRSAVSTFTVHAEQLAFTGIDHRRVIEPGRVTFRVGRSSADLPLTASVELTGPTVDVPTRTQFRTRSRVE
jgi:hypothetical protein